MIRFAERLPDLRAATAEHLDNETLDRLHVSAIAMRLINCEHLGEEFTAKDFRTWGGTLVAAIALAEHGPAGQRTRSKKG